MTEVMHLRDTAAPRVILFHAVVNGTPSRIGWRERKYQTSVRVFRSHFALLAGSSHSVLDLFCLNLPLGAGL